MTAAFDTLAAAEALQDAGIDPKKARAIVATARAAAGAGRDSLATKAELRAALAALETRLTWRMTGIVAALLAAQGALIVALLQPAVS